MEFVISHSCCHCSYYYYYYYYYYYVALEASTILYSLNFLHILLLLSNTSPPYCNQVSDLI
jgi:hypothetical protein